MSYLVNLLTK